MNISCSSSKAVILDLDTLGPDDLDLTELYSQAGNWQVYGNTAKQHVAERIANAEIVLTNKVPIDAACMAHAKQLKLIVVMATGTNNIDLKTAVRAGITVCNAVNYSTAAVVQHTFALILALTTRLLDYTRAVDRGDWQQSDTFCMLDYPITELAGKNIGIIGYGNLGCKVAAVAQALDMQVLVAESLSASGRDIGFDRMPIEQLMTEADIVTLHCPLTEATRHLINAKKLAQMKPSALLINTARGGIVDEQALAKALQAGTIAGAALDVLAEEPPGLNSLLLQGDTPNLLVSPHIAWASRESRQRLVAQLVAVIKAYRRGKPVQVVS